MSLATNIYEYAAIPVYLGYPVIGHIEEHLVKFRQEGCKGVLILLSTYGGEITSPEALISKIRDMSFEKVHTFILDAAFSAGTLLALLSDKIIGFSNSHVGPVDPQLVVSTPQGVPRVVSAMSVKRYIEKVLPKLAEEQKPGKDGLVRGSGFIGVGIKRYQALCPWLHCPRDPFSPGSMSLGSTRSG